MKLMRQSLETLTMSPNVLKAILKKQPFEPFRIVQSDGTGYDINHPDLLWVGLREVLVGLPSKSDPDLFERMLTLDLLHVIRTEPLSKKAKSGKQNGQGTH